MQGPIMRMSSVFNTNPTFPRSQSSSNIHDLGSVDYKRLAVRTQEELPRSASFSCLPNLESQYSTDKDVHRVVSAETSLAVSPERNHKATEGNDMKIGNRLTKEERPKLERVGRRKSLVTRPKSWIQRVRESPERHEPFKAVNKKQNDIPPIPPISKATRDKTKTVSESFATFAKKSWIISSRSPSPSRNREKDGDQNEQVDDTLKTASTVSSSSPRRAVTTSKIEQHAPIKVSGSPSEHSVQSSTTLSKTKSRPQGVLMNFTTFESANSSTSSLPRSSMDAKSTPRTSTDKIPLAPKNFSTEKLHIFGVDTPRKKDELLTAFKMLENDFSKFQSKSWSLKTNVVRAAVIPFLRNYAAHPSNKNLGPEDLDRRVKILNKWWVGILEVLDGRQNQTVSGVDRPVLLEAVAGIMTRPEWRKSPSAFAPLSDRSPNQSTDGLPLRSQKSSTSLKSSASQFMVESIYHNVRNMFIQNLLSQMSYVVDKMSLRHAPASLVTFCGKAVAYAFYFVPGVADELVRIWKLQVETLRRAADELGLPRRLNRMDTEEVAVFFPLHIQQLAWTSIKSMTNQLRQRPLLPILASKINWNGPWIARWCGRDSDLFFVFTKHYHILAEEFFPSDMTFVGKSRAPGFVFVQAQVLIALDATIHRQPPVEPFPITFDDVLAGADASAAALPLPSNNSARLMAENRLIMLLRDFISERPSEYEAARLTFAEAFSRMMQAGARRTSVFDHNACFVLCDFMEEALIIFIRFHHSHALESDFIDWRFWMHVCMKMLESQNSMSEIRLFSFLFGAWNVITHDERRKEILCLEWLLAEENFNKYFNHWCPMVRAYYMRLLCWRMCRDDGESTDLDTKIFCTASTRMKTNWAHYLFLKQAADKAHILPPSTAPCHPAPGRRLLIIRNDNQSPATTQILGFDGIASPSVTPGIIQASTYKRHSSLATLSKLDIVDASAPKLTTDSPTSSNKKRWTFMGKMLPSTFTTVTGVSLSPTQSRSSSPTKTLEEARRETALARSRQSLPSKTSRTDNETSPMTGTTYKAFSFKFSLEWSQHFDKAQNNINGSMGGRGGPGLNAGHERRICPPRLPVPAQAWLGARVPGTSREVAPRDPAEGGVSADIIARARYSGRALAEWTLIVGECNNFVERRRNEGVPGLKWVEVPTLGVEGFRKSGASG